MSDAAPRRAVTFDFGQTLAELDPLLLAARVAERGVEVEPARLEQATAAAWEAYALAKSRGRIARAAWAAFMSSLLEGAGVAPTAAGELAEWLFDEQPARNLWRRPVPGMIEVARALAASGVPIGILSNSEGRLRALVAELGWSETFGVVADSGVLGFEKPDRRIFEWTARELGVPVGALVHVGDVWEADVEGALAVGATALWLGGDDRALPPRVVRVRDAAATRAALVDLGFLGRAAPC
ncbi:MAG: HAD-IA family hydrolase [Polyangiaceae bacterium]|nr:HAD-IA family hydrolase [Polyangiaceae bacterium]